MKFKGASRKLGPVGMTISIEAYICIKLLMMPIIKLFKIDQFKNQDFKRNNE